MFHIDWFWLFILGVSVAGIISTIVRTRGGDPDGSPRFGLLVGSIMTFFVGIGLGLMSVVIHMGDVVWPLVGVAGLLWCISAGLFVSSRLAPGPRNP